MALALNDRVQQTGTANTTVSFTLSGTVQGFQSFAVIGNGNTTFYSATDQSGNWEVGLGTYSTTGPTLTRTSVYASSNSGSAVTFSGTVSVFVTYPAEKSVNLNAAGVMEVGSPIGYSDTGIIATFASTVAGYNQVVFQNLSNATNASSNINVSNNVSTSTTGFAELGINSSTFTGSGSFNIAGAAYLASASTDLTIGTYGAYNLHFVTNSSTTDSMTIFNDGGISLGGYPNPGIGNISANKFVPGYSEVTSAGGTTTLTAASNYYQRLVGTSAQTFQLPAATTLVKGTTFIFDNDSTGTLTIKDGAGTTIDTIPSTGIDYIYVIDNATVAGTWIAYSLNPSNYDFTSTSANFGGATISNAIWNGTAIASGYGGTGLTGFAAANNALYSTSSSALTAGTLPVAAGGTGITSLTANYIPVGNGTSGFSSSASLQFASGVLVVGGSSVLGGATNPITAFTGNTNNYIQTYVYNQSTGISGSSDFVAYTNNSTDAHGWADMGFTSSTYADTVYTVTGPNEAYVFGSAPSGAGATGNLVFATDSTGSANAMQFYIGGFTQLKSAWKMQLTSTGLQLANALATSYGGTGSTSTTYCSLTTNVNGTLPIANGGTGLTSTPANGALDIGNGTGFTRTTLTAGSGISITNGAGSITIAASGGAAVTSVSGTSPVVSSGGTTPAISLASGYGDTQNPFASKTANYFLAAPNGVAGAPTFRAIVAADIPTLNQNTTGSSGSCTGNAATATSATSATTATTATTANALNTANNYQVNSLGVGTAASGTAGEIRATNNVTAYYSDIRLKTKVGDIVDPLGQVRQIETLIYHANETAVALGYDASVIEVGVNAQSVKKVQPYATAPAPIDPQYLTVRYERLVPLLLESIKVLEDRIIALEARLAGQ